MENELLTELEQKIGYQFKDKGLLKHAMSHSSYANERHMGKLKSNERLEFLGDAVLELVTSEYKPLAKIAKDTAAGAVLIAAIMAAIAGLIIFVPKGLVFLGLL